MSSWRGGGGGGMAAAKQQQQQQQQQQLTENGPRAKCDQVVFEAIAKAAEIVVGSRCHIGGDAPNNTPHYYQPGTLQGTAYSNGGSNRNGATSSGNSGSRFNLMVPEVQGVRSILQRWKRALHVPLRLDVYYQHPDQRRELLERWCLEYAPSHVQQQHFDYNQQQHPFSNDPIVQLRHVCKKIVIWLRTLYCWSRMLPSQALRGTTIGFSIYVVSEGNDDVTSLVSNQQFRVQGGGGGGEGGAPAGVSTPYGQLGWKVFYAPAQAIERLIPRPTPYHTTPTNITHSGGGGGGGTSTQAMPIAIPGQQQQQQQQQQYQQQQYQHQFDQYVRRDSSPTPTTVQSAPHHNRQMMYQRSHSAVDAVSMSPELGKPHPFPRSHSGRGIVMATGRGGGGGTPGQHYQHQQQPPYLPGSPGTPGGNDNGNGNGEINGSGPPPSKTLSGLSLAMMMSDENVDANDSSANNNNNGEPTAEAAATTNSEQAEKRRAALHHAPPQLLLQKNSTAAEHTGGVSSSPVLRKSNLSSAGDYGYAYNSHIPSLRPMNNNHNNEQQQQQQQLQQQQYFNNSYNNSATSFGGGIDRTTSASPSMGGGGQLGSTPPGYLGATPPQKAGYLTGATPPTMMMMNQNRESLIPPRSAVTPPFVRPMGFMVDTNLHNNTSSSPSMPQQGGGGAAAAATNGGSGGVADSTATPHTVASATTLQHNMHTPSSKAHPPPSTGTASATHPVTSLDLLHSSPFQHPPNGSLLSSLSVQDPSYMNSVLSGDFRLQAAAEAAAHGAGGGAGDDPFHRSSSLFGYHQQYPSSAFLDDYYNSTGGGGGGGGADEMPFAVEDGSPPPFSSSPGFGNSGAGGSTGTSHLASSAAVASFAQRCSTASRLALFDSLAQQQSQQHPFHGSSVSSPQHHAQEGMSSHYPPQDMAVSSLADQLAEFKTFGASLMLNSTNTGGAATSTLGGPSPSSVVTENVGGDPSVTAANSTTTPISLRS